MASYFLSSEDVLNLMCLAETNAIPPPAIQELKEEIAGRIRVAELRSSVTGKVDLEEVMVIAGLKRKLDELYGLWAKGEI